MQIQSANSGTWINPAAISQQGASNARGASTGTGPSSNAIEGPNALERSNKTGDRDAQERYEGPAQHHQHSSQPNHESTFDHDEESHASILELPADDDSPKSSLDLLG